MRHGAPGRRSRNNRGSHGGGGQNHNGYRGSGNGSNGNRMQVFDSNGPEVRIRGTAHQICEKYQLLARDAAAQSNWVLSQSYLQHAEHYQRIINSWAAEPVSVKRTTVRSARSRSISKPLGLKAKRRTAISACPPASWASRSPKRRNWPTLDAGWYAGKGILFP